MSGGLYSTEVNDFDQTLDLKKIKPYGDTMNDGKTQISFTLPVPDGEEGIEAAKQLMKKMGFENPLVVFHKELTKGFTFSIVTVVVPIRWIIRIFMFRRWNRHVGVCPKPTILSGPVSVVKLWLSVQAPERMPIRWELMQL